MGECLIARGQTATKNVLDDIPVSGDYCSIVVLLQDSAGGPCENTKINCKDGTRWYNYTTNEAGMVLFKCNSGAANITPNNFINGTRTFDQDGIGTLDIDSPVGTKILKEIKFNKNSKFYRADSGWYNGWFRTIDRINNVIVVGGGGGGGSGTYGQGRSMGGGGGGGAKNFVSYIDISKNQIYNLYIGGGGGAGRYNNNGLSGNTSSAFGLSANGGGGGYYENINRHAIGGYGMFNGGNGGKYYAPYQYSTEYITPSTDGINGAGGGGGAGTGQGYGEAITVNWGLGRNNGGGNGGKSVGAYDSYSRDASPGAKGSGGGGGGGGIGGQIWHNIMSETWSQGGAGGSGRVEFDM